MRAYFLYILQLELQQQSYQSHLLLHKTCKYLGYGVDTVNKLKHPLKVLIFFFNVQFLLYSLIFSFSISFLFIMVFFIPSFIFFVRNILWFFQAPANSNYLLVLAFNLIDYLVILILFFSCLDHLIVLLILNTDKWKKKKKKPNFVR